MQKFFEIMNQPIVITLLSLFFGGFMANLVIQYRAQREQTRTKAIKFLDEIAGEISSAFSLLFNCIKKIPREEMNKRLLVIISMFGELLEKRFSVKIQSEAYLGRYFWPCYEDLLIELMRILDTMISRIGSDGMLDDISNTKWKKVRRRLNTNWRLPTQYNPYLLWRDPPYRHLYLWLSTTWDRAAIIFSRNLQAATGIFKTPIRKKPIRDLLPKAPTKKPVRRASLNAAFASEVSNPL